MYEYVEFYPFDKNTIEYVVSGFWMYYIMD